MIAIKKNAQHFHVKRLSFSFVPRAGLEPAQPSLAKGF